MWNDEDPSPRKIPDVVLGEDVEVVCSAMANSSNCSGEDDEGVVINVVDFVPVIIEGERVNDRVSSSVAALLKAVVDLSNVDNADADTSLSEWSSPMIKEIVEVSSSSKVDL